MHIEWNRVTWYSKMLVLALFVALPFIGFYYGMQYGKTLALVERPPAISGHAISAGNGETYYNDVRTWQIDRRDDAGWSVAYPIDFETNDIMNIKAGAQFSLKIPKAFEPQTNFNDATLTIGTQKDAVTMAQCLAPDQNGNPGAASASSADINGASFAVFHASDAGAGNLYDTTSYKTFANGKCYVLEYTIHSSQLLNYPAEYKLHAFNEDRASLLLDAIVGTFKFL